MDEAVSKHRHCETDGATATDGVAISSGMGGMFIINCYHSLAFPEEQGRCLEHSERRKSLISRQLRLFE
ncbi:MAG: hypothetical protein ACI4MB_03325 [Candidatus Coproplasma sp.]